MALLAACGLVGLAAAPAGAADDGPTWSVTPAANDYGSARQNAEYTVNAGDRIDDGIVVDNPGADALDLTVYGADAFTTDEGALDLRTQGADATGVGAWLEAGTQHVVVPAGQSVDVPFSIAVPADAAAGDHLGGIVTARTVTSGGQQVEQRAALTVHVHVAGFFRPGLQVEDLRTSYSGPAVGSGDATVTYTLHNTGNAILSARQDVSVGGPLGVLATRAASVADPPYLLPGESWPVSVPVHGVARTGWLSTTVALTPLYTDPAGSTNQLASVTAGTHGWALSWLLVLVAVVVLALVAWLVAVLVRVVRRSLRARRTPGDEPAAQPETSLSENRAHEAARNTTT